MAKTPQAGQAEAQLQYISPDLLDFDPNNPRFAGQLSGHTQDEIQKLTGKVKEKGLTLVPLQMYFKSGRVKVALALVKGKQDHDKRETIRRREVDRETRAAVKERQR
jgi:SsrA-binding protein